MELAHRIEPPATESNATIPPPHNKFDQLLELVTIPWNWSCGQNFNCSMPNGVGCLLFGLAIVIVAIVVIVYVVMCLQPAHGLKLSTP